MAGLAITCEKLLPVAVNPELLGVGEVTPDPRWVMSAHSHVFHELIVIVRGRLRLRIEGLDVVGEAGDVLLYRAGRVHTEASDPAAPVATIFFCFDAGEESLRDVPVRVTDSGGRLRQIAAWLLQDQLNGTPAAAQSGLLGAFLAELRRLSASPADPMLARVRSYLQQRMAEPLRLGDIARCARMSKFAFVRKYKRLSGRTPMQELRLLRLNQARAMMLTSGLPAKAIAPAVGLGDEYQLSKLFRRHFNLTPRELRIRKVS